MQISVSIKCLKIKYEIKNDDICLKIYTGYVQIILTIDERFYCFCSFLSGHCLSKQERGTWPQEILWKLCWWSTNMSASSEELCQLGFAMMYSWLHQTYSLNQVASNHQYRNQPLLKVFFCRVRQWQCLSMPLFLLVA